MRDHGGEDAFSRAGRDPAYLEAVRVPESDAQSRPFESVEPSAR